MKLKCRVLAISLLILFSIKTTTASYDSTPSNFPETPGVNNISRRSNRLISQRHHQIHRSGRHEKKRTSSRGPKDQRPGETLSDYCRRACAEGRGTSREAYIYCGGCNAYSDEAASEYRDFPF